MRVFVRAVITGIGLSIGKMLYEKVSERFGEKKAAKDSDDAPEPVMPDEDNDDPVADRE